jgi:hypothetical protein
MICKQTSSSSARREWLRQNSCQGVSCSGGVRRAGSTWSSFKRACVMPVFFINIGRIILATEVKEIAWWCGFRLLTQRANSGPTHGRTEGRAPVRGSELTLQKPLYYREEKEELVLNPFIVVFGPVFTSAYCSRGLPGLKSSPSGNLG